MQTTMTRSEAKLFRLALMTLTLTLTSARDDWDQSCGALCSCKWFSGKKTAECINQKLTYVPTDLSSEIQTLDLTSNHIPYLSDNAFSDANLVNLHKIVLRRCEIESIDASAFNGLRIVIEIDLAANRIKAITPGTFAETQRLTILQLNDNNLEFLDDDLFRDLLYLQKVVLSHNCLVRIGEKAFSNLPGLQTLALNGNNLTSLSLGTFDYLPKLSSLDLHENPWNCDCHLKEFREWTLERRLYTRPTRCDQPAGLAGRMWDDVASEDFDCRPRIQVAPGFDLGGNLGGDARLWCRSSGSPRPQLSWIRGSMVLRNSTRRPGEDRGYVLTEAGEWLNLTIPEASASDGGDYVCQATSSGGRVEKNVGLTMAEDPDEGGIGVGFPLTLGLGATLLVILLAALGGFAWYRRRGAEGRDKSTVEGSPDRHGLGEPGKSSVAAVNPGKLAAASQGSLATELNGTLVGSDSVFPDGPPIAARADDVRGFPVGDHLYPDALSLGAGSMRLAPDLLGFRAVPGVSQAHRASPGPADFRPATSHSTGAPGEPGPPMGSPTGAYPSGFRTLPHNRSFGATSSRYNSGLGVMLRHGYVTIPRRPRPPSWGSDAPATGPTAGPAEGPEPVYDNLGQRTTADGSSVLSLNKSPEPISPTSSMRGRPLPMTPTGNPLYTAVQRSTPNILTSSPLDRSAPEGAPGWPARLPDDINLRIKGNVDCRTLGRKLPPRPPPKPENRLPPGPLFEDEGEDGTEV